MDHRSLRAEAEKQHHERIRRHADGGSADARQDRIAVAKGVHAHERHDHPGKPLTKLKDGGSADGHRGHRRLDRPGRRRRDDGGMTQQAPPYQSQPQASSQMNQAQQPNNAAIQNALSAGILKDLNKQQAPPGQKRGGRTERARGGRSPHGKGPAHVNVIVASGQAHDRPVPVPVPAAGGAPMPPRPPMPPPGMMGPGGPGGMPMAPGAGMGGMPPGMARPPMMPPPGMGGGPPGMPIRARGGRLRAEGGRAEAGEAHGKELAVGIRAGSHSGEGRLLKSKMKVENAAAAGD